MIGKGRARPLQRAVHLPSGVVQGGTAFHRTTLVGRTAELAHVMDVLEAAGAGEPGTVVVSGESGIGKTRLVEEVVDQATSAGFLVASGRCTPVDSLQLPYGPIVELIDELVEQYPELPEMVPRQAWHGIAPLTGLVLHSVGSDLGLASTRLFAGFVEVLSVASTRQPALVVLEDVHWADPATADLIAFTARKLRRRRIALLLTWRPEVSARSSTRPDLIELMRLPGTTTVNLGALSKMAIHELLDQVPVPANAAVRRRAAENAEGIPFYALHLARHSDADEVPPHLRDILLHSLDNLTSRERTFIVLLGVVGDSHEEGLLASAAGLTIEDFAHIVRRLRDRGLITAGDGTIGFRHALLREVVVDDTLPSERLAAHMRAADALLARRAADDPRRASQLGHHLSESGRHPEAIGYLVRGARHATAIWAFDAAMNQYQAALRLWPLCDDARAAAGVTHADLLREAALSCRWCGQVEDAIRMLTAALSLDGLSPAGRARNEHALGHVLWAAGERQKSLDAYQRAAALITGDERLSASNMGALARGMMATGRSQDAIDLGRRAAEIAASAGDTPEQIHALITVATAQAQMGEFDVAIDGLRGCLPHASRLDDMELVLRCYANLGFALGTAGRNEEAAAVAAEGVAACRRFGPASSVSSVLVYNQIGMLIVLGRWAEADHLAQEALNDAAASSDAASLHQLMAELAVAQGDAAGAETHLAAAKGLGSDNTHLQCALSVLKADHELWNNDPQSAATMIADVLPELVAHDDLILLLEACSKGLRAAADTAENLLHSDRRAQTGTDGLLTTARQAFERIRLPAAAALMTINEAEAARITSSDTDEHWSAAARTYDNLSQPYERAYSLMRLGAVQLRRNARALAVTALTEGLAVAEALGAQPLVAEIRTLVDVGGLRLHAPSQDTSPAAGSGHDDLGLTPREQQVLALLTTGATNRAVARTLYISERTASVHVSNILTKLGVTNRTQAARMALKRQSGHVGPAS